MRASVAARHVVCGAVGQAEEAHAAEDEYYLVDHSTFSYLVLPGHGFTEFFRRDLSAEAVADRISCFMDNA